MKIKTEQDLSCNEIEVIIKYPQKNKQVHRIIDFLQSFDMQIKCAGDNAEQIINILATTGISLLLLSVVALFFHASCIYLETVFQAFCINIITYIGIMIIQKIELRNIFTEMVLEILFIVGELLVFGRLFHWFTSLSFLLLVFMGVVIYIISYFLNLLQMKQEAIEINLLIKNRNKNQD